MNIFTFIMVALVVLGTIMSNYVSADYHKKHLSIKHKWKKHGKGYGKGYGGGKKMTGYSKRHQHMKHGKGKGY
ncbi:hypothetical protein BLOT_006781 [Blomia tropicalis]|nr:hypothetical protein BLOT_006781 [Blomia tropicalis]